MEIRCIPSFPNRWKAEFWSDGVLYAEAFGQRPGCAMRDAINEFCLKYGMPENTITFSIEGWD